jgi:GrpB-like predicted nucleotidyltransferase (UPF0157 family)
LRIEHAGSTAVPGLAAKPVIDIILVVIDAPDLEAAGYRLHIREPNWYQHRMFKGPDTDVNLHVFPHGCSEIDRMLMFRGLAARQCRRSRSVRAHQAGFGREGMEIGPELRRCQDRRG